MSRRLASAPGRSRRERPARRDDGGHILVIVVVLIALLTAFAPDMASLLNSEGRLLESSVNGRAAMAAAEAGIQWYRNHLNTSAGYFAYSAADNPTGDAALSGWCGAGEASSCDLSGTDPAEAFHYSADDSHLFSQSGPLAGQVLLHVTGRAGSSGNYAYAYVEATFNTTSLLDNAYYSSFEVLDPSSNTVAGIPVTSTASGAQAVSTPEVSYQVSYRYQDDAGTTVQVSNVSVWSALCQYDTYQENTFYDSLGVNGYSTSHPYYGPYLGGAFSFHVDGATSATPGEVDASGTTTVSLQSLPCGNPYDFVSGETFNGPVYTNDQLHVCDNGGEPQFNGLPLSLTSGASSDIPYKYDVPGSVAVSASNAEPNGPYPPSLIPANNGGAVSYLPGGVVPDDVNCQGGGDAASLKAPAYGPALNGSQSLPSLNSGLAAYGTDNPPAGVSGTGCTYTGPTMIELVTHASTTTMDIWSPLSSAALGTTSQCANAPGQTSHSFSATTPFVAGVPLPSDDVVYVQDYLLQGTALPAVPADGSTPCFNPYRASLSTDAPHCYEGDVYVEGELSGQLTIASSANILVTRDLTYSCSDGSGGANVADPSSVSACTAGIPDVLGLSAKYDVLVSGNDPNAGGRANPQASAQDCIANGFGDGSGLPSNTPTAAQLRSAPYSTDTNLRNDPAAVWPTLCNPTNVVIDAAVFALNGSFGIDNWDTTPTSGGAHLNGSDLSKYRGPFGYVGMTGYTKQFSFDSRLEFTPPPALLQSSFDLWQQRSYVVCTSASCPPL